VQLLQLLVGPSPVLVRVMTGGTPANGSNLLSILKLKRGYVRAWVSMVTFVNASAKQRCQTYCCCLGLGSQSTGLVSANM